MAFQEDNGSKKPANVFFSPENLQKYFPMGVVGLLAYFIGKKQAEKGPAKKRGLLGILLFILAVALVVMAIYIIVALAVIWGLWFTWKKAKWPLWTKWVITAIGCVILIIIAATVLNLNSAVSEKNTSKVTSTTSTARNSSTVSNTAVTTSQQQPVQAPVKNLNQIKNATVATKEQINKTVQKKGYISVSDLYFLLSEYTDSSSACLTNIFRQTILNNFQSSDVKFGDVSLSNDGIRCEFVNRDSYIAIKIKKPKQLNETVFMLFGGTYHDKVVENGRSPLIGATKLVEYAKTQYNDYKVIPGNVCGPDERYTKYVFVRSPDNESNNEIMLFNDKYISMFSVEIF